MKTPVNLATRVMIINYAPWTREAYFLSKHPEYAGIRNIALPRASFNRSSAILAISDSISSELRDDYHVSPGKPLVPEYEISNRMLEEISKALNPFGNNLAGER